MTAESKLEPRANRLFSSLRYFGVDPQWYQRAVHSAETMDLVARVFQNDAYRGDIAASWGSVLPGEERNLEMSDKIRFVTELARRGVGLECVAEVGRNKAWSQAVAQAIQLLTNADEMRP